MPRVKDVLTALERIAPKRYALSFDRVGLQVGDPEQEVRTAVVSLDRSLAAVSFAREQEAQLLLSHHPLIFSPLSEVTSQSHVGRTTAALLKSDISFVAAHTNWDAAVGGINDALAQALCLENVKPFGEAAEVGKLKLVFFVPLASADAVIDAVADAGAGVIGLYRRCAFLSRGTGTFHAEEGSHPAIGSAGETEEVEEWRVEMVVDSGLRNRVENVLVTAHPYEEPAYDFYELAGVREQPLGRLGELSQSETLPSLCASIEASLKTRCIAWGKPDSKLQKVAVVGGSADGEWMAAQRSGADVLITGEVKQHVALEASESGFCIVAAGHYATEQPGCVALAERMQSEVAEVDWRVFEPAPGAAGRPL